MRDHRRQVLLITGCSSGIGRATALRAASRGHRVFASARRPEDLRELEGAGMRALSLDVTDATSIDRAIASVFAEAGRLDALVNNAGYGQYGAVEEVLPEEWQEQFDVNVFGSVRVLQKVLPAMRLARRGTIVNVSSVAGKLSIPFAAAYCASKHALEAISDALRVELAPFGIRVVVVEPGPIATKFAQRARHGVARIMGRPGPYADFYVNAERAMDSDFQTGRLPPEAVARVILDAVESESPRARYRVTSMAKVLIPLRRLMPDSFFDWGLRKALKLPDKA